MQSLPVYLFLQLILGRKPGCVLPSIRGLYSELYNGGHNISQKYLSEHFKSLKCYKLSRRCSPLPLMLASPMTCAVYPWPVDFTCALMQNKGWVFNYRHFRDTWSQWSLRNYTWYCSWGGNWVFFKCSQ